MRHYWHMTVTANSDTNGGGSSSGSDSGGSGTDSSDSTDSFGFGSLVYDTVFAASHMAGNIGGFDVTATTWFGDEAEYVHGINL